ncbi:excinuclease ABC subunit B, partial [Salmonella enterica subsp. enterica]|nr:excinuclease ABC subunit B [Salmonella enterica subsp. enterica]
ATLHFGRITLLGVTSSSFKEQLRFVSAKAC